MDYVFHILVLVAVYGILSSSLDLLVGHTGIVSLAHGAFFGVGAYCSALAAVHHHIPFPFSLVLGMVISGVLSLLISLPCVTLQGEYLVVCTFAFQLIASSLFLNWVGVTGGAQGIAGIPPLAIPGIRSRGELPTLLLAGTMAIAFQALVNRIGGSPWGRVLHAIREDEVFAQALGKDTLRAKVTAFALSACIAAVAGSLYAHYIGFIDPSTFGLPESVLILCMLTLGGAGSRWGPLLGAALLVALPEALRMVGIPASVSANLRQILYGSALVALIVFRPCGLVGRYAPVR